MILLYTGFSSIIADMDAYIQTYIKTYIYTYFIVTSPKGLFRNNDDITLFIIANYNT